MFMRRKNYIQDQLVALDASLSNLRRLVNTSAPLEEYLKQIDQTKDIIGTIESLIEQEN